jgi:SAM-dependent methyltransferase
VPTAGGEEHIFDFRVQHPAYCTPPGVSRWQEVQEEFEESETWFQSLDDPAIYVEEIGAGRDIYAERFAMAGRVLDVGGSQGRLRYFLHGGVVSLYVSVDPHIEAFKDVGGKPNLLRTYPQLSEPCNFLACHAEHIPFRAGSFDWVHMRSVLDHFHDPFLALKEAYRVLRPSGLLLIGLTVRGGPAEARHRVWRTGTAPPLSLAARIVRKVRREGHRGLVRALRSRFKVLARGRRDHTFHWNYADLIHLLTTCSFAAVTEHWLPPPYSACIYLLARKT